MIDLFSPVETDSYSSSFVFRLHEHFFFLIKKCLTILEPEKPFLANRACTQFSAVLITKTHSAIHLTVLYSNTITGI